MQGSTSLPAALGSSKWIASFLAKNRSDDDIYVRTHSPRSSQNEVKFQGLYQKATAELRTVFRSTKSDDSGLHAEKALKENLKNTPKQQEKSTWAILFDTKSGNKLHKRTRSAPTNTHVPHVLETIGEEQEDQESSALKSLVKTAQESEQDPKTVTAAPKNSDDRVSHDADNASIQTTCTVIIRQATFNDEEETRVNAETKQSSPSNDTSKPKTVSFDIPSSRQPRKKAPSITSSIFSFMEKVVRLGKSSSKKSTKPQLEPRIEPSGHKKTMDRRPILKWNLPQEDNAMNNLIRDFSGPLTPPDSLDISTPPPSNGLGRSITNVSAFDNSVEDLIPMPATRPTWVRPISDSDSMQDFDDDKIHNPRLRPKHKLIRQKTKANEDDSTIMSDEEVHTTPATETEDQAYERHHACIQRIKEMYDLHGIDRTGKFLEWEPKQREAVEQRQVREMTEDLEQPPHDIQTEKDEVRSHHETTVSKKTAHSHDDTQEVLNVNKTPNQELSTHEPPTHESPIEESSNQKSSSQQVIAPDATAPVSNQEVTSPDTTVVVSNQGPQNEQPAEHEPNAATLTNDTASTSTWEYNEDIPLPLGARLTKAAIVEHQNEEYSAFFKSLQRVREQSPDRLCGREGSFSVRAWLDQTYDNENELLKEDPQISFSHDAVSTVEDEDEDEDDTLPGSGPYPSSDEIDAALAHPNAPAILGSAPHEAREILDKEIRSYNLATLKKEELQAQVQSSLARNEIIEDEHDRADRVAYLFLQKQKKKAMENEADPSKAAEIRRVRKVCREFEQALQEVQRRAALANKEANDAKICLRYLDRCYNAFEEDIHRLTQRLGHQRANNLVDAVELVRQTEREENIDYRDVERLDLAEPESPDSYGATEFMAHEALADNNVGPEAEDPTDIFF
ncbi:hypothetical protein FPOA_00325 [Fusarium poae]|uniref:Uncharacterized protein n=1 Tax=Fusarium poae TaxID=36050 RepID=A0A1B8B0Z1_FUSPO|nr:hypothetical protein FPOA_00325 [Fusarium poae]